MNLSLLNEEIKHTFLTLQFACIASTETTALNLVRVKLMCVGLLQKAEEARTPVQTGPTAGEDQDEPEELDFMFDEEMEQIDGRRNTFTDWSDEDSDCEIDDRDVNKILIVTQTPPYLRKHPGGDRTGNHTSRSKLTNELVKTINDGLYYYEQDLWDDTYEPEYATIKVSVF